MICLEQDRDGSVLIKVIVQPRASANCVSGIYGGSLKVRITAPPVDGEANRMVTKFLAKMFKVPKSFVDVKSGKNSRNKTIKISGAKKSGIEKILFQQFNSSS